MSTPGYDEGGAGVVGVKPRRDRRAGMYVHIPFCARQCPYCDFAVSVEREIPHEAYATALIEELDDRRSELAGRDMRTLYFGGGTPSLWEIASMRRFIEALEDRCPTANLREVCMEANPDDISAEKLQAWSELGVTRLSIGIQSFQDDILRVLNRNHDARTAVDAVERALAADFEVVSFDLMFGIPQQEIGDWERDLEMIEEFGGLRHLSGYNLTIEPGTAFERREKKGRLTLPPDELSLEMLSRLVEVCEANGLERYEVSNFAAQGARSRHNTLYWTGAEYLGLGMGAHSLRITDDGRVLRRANIEGREEYAETPTRPDTIEVLTAGQHLVERLFLGVRTRAGLDWAEVEHQFGDALPAEMLVRGCNLLEEMTEEGFLECEDGVFRPTHRGLDVADALARRFANQLDDS